MTAFIFAQGSRGLGRGIARIMEGEPWAWLELLACIALVVVGTLAYRWWISRV